MKKTLVSFFIITLLFCARSFAQQGANFSFIENKGQWDESVKYYGELNAGGFYLSKNGFTVLLHNQKEVQAMIHSHSTDQENQNKAMQSQTQKVLHSHAYRLQFSGANENVQIIPDKKENTFTNYFLGNDPAKWASRCNSYNAITYKNIYPNIDLHFYSNEGRLKYDFIVYPGGNPRQIVMKYEGADGVNIKNKELVIRTSVGEVKELAPSTFQYDDVTNERKTIPSAYRMINDSTVGFKLGSYSEKTPLVIDPTLVFATFTGSAADNWGFSATPGPDGTTFFAGIVFNTGFPVSPGAFQTTYQGGVAQKIDIGVMKLSSDGSTRLYATYLGGSNDEYPHSLISDPAGNLIVMGRSYSSNYPSTTTIGPGGGSDIVITKLRADGTGIIGSIRIGGSSHDGLNIEGQHQTGQHRSISLVRFYGDDSRSEVILDDAGNIYVAANTQSANFPVTGGVFQPAFGGGTQDGVVLKIDPSCNNLLFASFIGGPKEDGAYVLALHPQNDDIYLAGATASSDFPGNKAGVIQPSYAGGIADGFVAIIANNGSALKKSTYLGTNSVDGIYGIQFDKLGFPYVMGSTRGSWPVLNATFVNPGAKQFISKLKPDLSAFLYSTTFGTSNLLPNISPVAFMVDNCENVYISGWGGYLFTGQDPYGQAGTTGMPITPDAIKSTTDGYDFYFIVIKKNASQLLYGTFYGQNGGMVNDHVDGGTSRYDKNGVIHQAVCANCGGGAAWPTTPGSWSPQNGTGGKGCNLAAIKIAFDFSGVASGVKSYVNNKPDSSGCAPFTVTLKDTVRNAVSYEWNFGDGTPGVATTNAELSYTYNSIGTYRVRLIAIDSTTCNIRDTSYTTIRVRDDQVNLNFRSNKLPPCQSLTYSFDNLSLAPPAKPLTNKIFVWDFGDGFRQTTTGTSAVTHSYAAAGTYRVRLIITDTAYCNAPDSVEQVLRVAPLVKSLFQAPASGCAPYNALFNNLSEAGQTFSWDFGDGTGSSDVNPVHQFAAGTYRVRLIAIDSATCNIADTSYQTIVVASRPVAGMSHTPVNPEANKPVNFLNTSTGAIRYLWLFGDGDSLATSNINSISHQYNATGVFNAHLVAYNSYGCSDTAHDVVRAIINPLVDVPNAFTPGRSGTNSIVLVKGFGIAKMMFRIYNRWGEKVFETTNQLQGWDGTYKGALQPMDVYAYTLEVEFSDGTKARKKGDITLIR